MIGTCTNAICCLSLWNGLHPAPIAVSRRGRLLHESHKCIDKLINVDRLGKMRVHTGCKGITIGIQLHGVVIALSILVGIVIPVVKNINIVLRMC